MSISNQDFPLPDGYQEPARNVDPPSSGLLRRAAVVVAFVIACGALVSICGVSLFASDPLPYGAAHFWRLLQPVPCGGSSNVHTASFAIGPKGPAVYYLCRDSTHAILEFEQPDTPGPRTPPQPQDTTPPDAQCVSGMTPSKDGRFCVAKGHPLAR